MITVKINPEKIRDVIGKGGSTIQALTKETGCTIDIQEDGTITIASTSSEGMAEAKRRIEGITAEAEVGKIYSGTVLKLLDFVAGDLKGTGCTFGGLHFDVMLDTFNHALEVPAKLPGMDVPDVCCPEVLF